MERLFQNKKLLTERQQHDIHMCNNLININKYCIVETFSTHKIVKSILKYYANMKLFLEES